MALSLSLSPLASVGACGRCAPCFYVLYRHQFKAVQQASADHGPHVHSTGAPPSLGLPLPRILSRPRPWRCSSAQLAAARGIATGPAVRSTSRCATCAFSFGEIGAKSAALGLHVDFGPKFSVIIYVLSGHPRARHRTQDEVSK